MKNSKPAVNLREIQKIVGQITKRFQPYKVILFGSYAQGKVTADSDVDLLVLMEKEQKPILAAAEIAAAIDHPFPIDIVVSTPAEFEAAMARHGNFATQVNSTGIVIYEAGNSEVD